MVKLISMMLSSIGVALMLMMGSVGEVNVDDPRVKPYMDEIRSIYKQCGQKKYISRLNRTSFVFKKLQANRLANCFPLLNKVEIDKGTWDLLPHYTREELLMHELGHCTLLQDHTYGIMQAMGMLDEYYIFEYNELINEYFRCGSKKCCNVSWKPGKYINDKTQP